MSDKVASLIIKVDSSAVKRATDRLEGLHNAGKRADRAVDELARGSRQANAGIRSFERSTRQAGRTTRAFGRNVDVTAKGLEGIIKRSIAAGAAFIAFNKLKEITRDVFDTTAAFERLDKQLEFVTRSSRNAGEAFEFLVMESRRTGQSVLEVAPSFAKLQFAMEQAGLTAEDARKLFTAVGSASATFGLAQSDVNGVLRAFIQVASKGKVQAEELRGQIGERLPGAFGMAARAMGMSTQELSKQLELGNVLATDLIPQLTDAMNEAFGQDMANKTETITAAVGRLKTEIALLVEDLDAADTFREFIDTLRLIARNSQDSVGEVAFAEAILGSPDLAKRSSEEIIQALGIARKELKEIENLPYWESGGLAGMIFRGVGKSAGPELTEVFDAFGVDLKATEKRAESLRATIEKLQNALKESREATEQQKEFNRVLNNTVFSARSLSEELTGLYGKDASTLSFELEKAAKSTDDLFMAVDSTAASFSERLQNINFDRLIATGAETFGQIREMAQSAFDFEGVAPVVNPFTDIFEELKVSMLTTKEEIERNYSASRNVVVGYYRAANREIDAEGQELLNRLKAQYDRDVANWEEAQRMKKIRSSEAAMGVLSATRAIEDGLVNAAAQGEAAFSDMFRFILAEIQRVAIRAAVLRPLFGFLGGSVFGAGSAIGAAFLESAKPTSAVGGFVPSGETSLVGEAGPELVKGPAVVTSTKSTADKFMGGGGYSHSGPVYNINADMRGASVEAVNRMEAMIQQLRRETPAIVLQTVQSTYHRDPRFLSKR